MEKGTAVNVRSAPRYWRTRVERGYNKGLLFIPTRTSDEAETFPGVPALHRSTGQREQPPTDRLSSFVEDMSLCVEVYLDCSHLSLRFIFDRITLDSHPPFFLLNFGGGCTLRAFFKDE